MTHKGKIYGSCGEMLSGDEMILVQDGGTVYYDPYGHKFEPNNILAQYKIIEKLGKGGFGTVSKAEHIETGQIVSIKHIDITEYSIIY